MNAQDKLLKTSRLAVWLATTLNQFFLASVLLGLLLSWIFSARFAAMLLHEAPTVRVGSEMTGLRLLMGIGIAMAVATGILLAALQRILDSARAGDPFAAENARRLHTIGWALLALQMLDLPTALLTRFVPSLGTAAPEVTFSPGGWVAVLMIFVLSRVFATGSVMKDDLEGTV